MMIFDELTKELMSVQFLKEPPMKKFNALSKGEIGTLLYLKFEKNNVLAGDISKRLKLTTGRTAIILKNLEKKGYINKIKGLEDCRRTFVSITDLGKEFVKKDGEEVFKSIRNILVFLGEEDARHFVRINKNLLENYDKDWDYEKEKQEKTKLAD